MRILIVHEHQTAPGQGGGGAESLLRDMSAALKGLGHTVAWLQSGHIEEAVEQFKPDFCHIQTIHNFIPNWQQMVRYLQDSRIPHLWALMDYWPFCGGRMCLDGPGGTSGKGCAAVTGKCDGNCQCGPAPRWVGELVNGSPVVALNEYTADIYRRNGIRADYVVELGVDVAMFAPDYSQRGEFTTIYTSSAWPEYPVKGMPVLQKAITGSPYQVRLVAHVPREVVAAELKKAHIYVFPSIYEETFGLSLCEAMASGCAVIASDVAGARAQVDHGRTGLLFPPGDDRALLRCIDWLMGDDNLRAELGRNAREHVAADHTLEAMGRRWEAVYREVLSGS